MTGPHPLDPFTVLGVEHTLDLDEAALERRYLALSRECHPDHHRARETTDCIAVLQRAADINDAWRILKDPWERARAVLELRAPGVIERTKTLDPEFLLAAMDEAEAVATANAAERPALRARLTAAVQQRFVELRAALQRGDVTAAAVAWQQAKYHNKALHDLGAAS